LEKIFKPIYFGEFSFFTDQDRGYKAKSGDFSNLFSIKRSEFKNYLKLKNIDDNEKF
jgi:hypothetical protein